MQRNTTQRRMIQAAACAGAVLAAGCTDFGSDAGDSGGDDGESMENDSFTEDGGSMEDDGSMGGGR